MNFWKWVQSTYSEPDGSGSSTRVIVSALIAFIIGVGISFGIATHYKKFSMEEFDNFLNASSTFILETCGPLYGVNKAADWAKNKSTNNPAQPGV